ncbi:DUF1822 family protein [Lyngbya aestuarii]|uniref:DUF1822 family protein n=1 Tax=Lyngbya aestuarii TaxID=118322 RepID=UPI00403D7944
MTIHAKETLDFTVTLAQAAHQLAAKFCQPQSNLQKAEQIYLNTLAVYAVNYYLQCLGFETDWKASDSWDSIMQNFLNVADLVVKNYGKLECRPVLPDAEVVYFLEEVHAERIGYIAVQINESLEEATLLGFTTKVTMAELPLNHLQSLEDLPKYITSFRPLANLSQWFEDVFETGWQSIETVFDRQPTELAYQFRLGQKTGVERCKLIELVKPVQSVALIVGLIRNAEQEMDISIKVQPTKGQTYLPENLLLMVLDEAGQVVMDARAKSANQNIQLELTGEPGDSFSVKVTLDEVSVTENFVV